MNVGSSQVTSSSLPGLIWADVFREPNMHVTLSEGPSLGWVGTMTSTCRESGAGKDRRHERRRAAPGVQL